MLTEIRDGDAIFSHAIVIASAEERATYIAGACGNNVALRRQVEERVAAHFQAGSSNNPARAAAVVHPNGHSREHGSANHAEAHADSPRVMHHAGKAEPTPRRSSAMTRVLLVLLAAATVASTSLAVWGMRAEKQAQAAEQQAVDERNHARKAEEEAKHQRDKALEAGKATTEQREQARKAEEAARLSEQDTKAVLAFLEDNLLSAGHAMGWGGNGQSKDLKLREAVDAAEAKIAETFADRPLVEASLREALGSTYLDLGEATQAVKQLERALALREAVLGADHASTGDCRNKLAVAYRLAGLTSEAGHLYDQNPNSSSHASALAVRGAILLSKKKPTEAELKLRECLAIRQKIQPDDWTTFAAKVTLGEALLEQKKYADAEPLLLSGYEGLKQREAKIPAQDKVRLVKGLGRLVQLYEAWGKKDQEARWRKELETAETPRGNVGVPGHRATIND
jgi:hypothetical protein